ncbi:MAG: transglutaminase-like domain-containing protein [Oscillospiraceae bacterium]|jgi:transglutaminase-like putative cysteine protease|nr:transglutaminase-like domain-containing protein [Oscillospiraceae bacterium]
MGRYRRAVPRSVGAALLCALAAACIRVPVAAARVDYIPQASGEVTYSKKGTTLDASHTDQGYVMMLHEGNLKRLKLRITRADQVFDYDLNGDGNYEVFPLQMGDGAYQVQLYQQVKDTKYSLAFSQKIKVSLADENLPYLYPSQYVNYLDTLALYEADALCADAATALDKLKAVRGYIKANIQYDYLKAQQVTSGQIKIYLPNLDDTYTSKRGICFDYAALVAGMLRSQGVPTKMIIGYADKQYHAWNAVLLDDGTWARYDGTLDVSNSKAQSYAQDRWY